jgi:hypothetical protein
MQHLQLRHWKTFQANYLSSLLKDKLFERTIPNKRTSRLQKYWLMKRGAGVPATMTPPEI